MGVVEGLQHSESPRTVAPTNVSHGEEKLGRLLPKYKKRRVSSVRDFPPGCGPFAHLNSLRPVQEVPSIVKNYPRRIVEAVREFPPLYGINAFLEAENLSREKSVMGDKPSSSNTAKITVKQTQVQPTTEKKRPREDPLDLSCQVNQLHGKAFERSELASHRVVVLGLMAASNNKPHKEDSKSSKLAYQLHREDLKSSKLASHRAVVLGLMAASNSVYEEEKGPTSVNQMMVRVQNI